MKERKRERLKGGRKKEGEGEGMRKEDDKNMMK